MYCKTKPFPHQIEAIEKFKDKNYFALFWEMGTGKSKTAIDILAQKYFEQGITHCVVVAPNTVHKQWIDEQFPTHCAVPYEGFVFRTNHSKSYTEALEDFIARSQLKDKLYVLAIHIEAFQYSHIEKWLAAFCKTNKTMFIVDEATRIKNPSAICTTRLTRCKEEWGTSACILTGTSLAKSPLGIWSMVEFLKEGLAGCSYTAFTHRHAVQCSMDVEGARGGHFKKAVLLNEWTFKRAKYMLSVLRKKLGKEELNRNAYAVAGLDLGVSGEDMEFIDKHETFARFKNIDKLKERLAPFSSFLRKEDCLELPEKIYKEVVLPLGKEQKRILGEMKELSVATYKDAVLTLQHKVALQTRALQVCGGFFPKLEENSTEEGKYICMPINEKNEKLDYIRNFIDEIGDQQFIVWAVFVPEIKMLKEELSHYVSTGSLFGASSKEERESVVRDFKQGKIQCLVANPSVAGYGLNLQNAGTQIWYSRNYSTEARLQAEDRSHRLGVVKSPMYIDLVYDVGFERAVLASIKEGRDMNSFFNEQTINKLFE